MDEFARNEVEKLAEKIRKLQSLLHKPTVKFKKLRPNAVLPAYQTAGASGMDLVACFDEGTDNAMLWEDGTLIVPTGIAIELPEGYEAQVRPRSGLAFKQHVTVLNAPGTIDADYRGELKALLINHGGQMLSIHNGDRIAQLVIMPVVQARIEEVTDLSTTTRGEGGFGSTGK